MMQQHLNEMESVSWQDGDLEGGRTLDSEHTMVRIRVRTTKREAGGIARWERCFDSLRVRLGCALCIVHCVLDWSFRPDVITETAGEDGGTNHGPWCSCTRQEEGD